MERVTIGFFGLRNAGKSSLVNAVTHQSLSIVSDIKGTTTDPVRKSMEILPIGPVCIIDTPGIDDCGELGEMRIKSTKRILDETDIAVFVTESGRELFESEKDFISELEKRNIKYIVVKNKSDIAKDDGGLNVCSLTGEGVEELIDRIAGLATKEEKYIVRSYINEGDTVVLVIPIDESAPKGRIILPQQQVLRELLDAHCSVVCTRETDLKITLERLSVKPSLVITDSQAFKTVSQTVEKDICLTSFSILFANYKGDLSVLKKGADAVKKLKDGDNVLICEGCTHHRQCNDIGTVKMPKWIENYSGKRLNFDFFSGRDMPENLSKYALIVHCGGCMLTDTDMKNRIKKASLTNVPIVNYGIFISKMNGILERSLEIFNR